jgi:hypothetical protein
MKAGRETYVSTVLNRYLYEMPGGEEQLLNHAVVLAQQYEGSLHNVTAEGRRAAVEYGLLVALGLDEVERPEEPIVLNTVQLAYFLDLGLKLNNEVERPSMQVDESGGE